MTTQPRGRDGCGEAGPQKKQRRFIVFCRFSSCELLVLRIGLNVLNPKAWQPAIILLDILPKELFCLLEFLYLLHTVDDFIAAL